jgi:hypothetical protein
MGVCFEVSPDTDTLCALLPLPAAPAPKPPKEPKPAKPPRAEAAPQAAGRFVTLADLLRCGALKAGAGVLTSDYKGVTYAADLGPSGACRCVGARWRRAACSDAAARARTGAQASSTSAARSFRTCPPFPFT